MKQHQQQQPKSEYSQNFLSLLSLSASKLKEKHVISNTDKTGIRLHQFESNLQSHSEINTINVKEDISQNNCFQPVNVPLAP